MGKGEFLCEIHAKQIVCIKTCEFAYKNRLYFHQYRKTVDLLIFHEYFLLAVQRARRTVQRQFLGKCSLEILIFSFGIGKLPPALGFCKICVKSGFSAVVEPYNFGFFEGLLPQNVKSLINKIFVYFLLLFMTKDV